MLPHNPTFPNEPHIEVQKPRGVGECCDRMTLDWYSVLVDLLVEGFTEGDGVAGVWFVRGSRGATGGKPKVEAVEKMKTRGIDRSMGIGMILGTEKDCCREDSLEALNNSVIVTTIGSKAEEIEHLKGSVKVNDATFLLHGEGSHPNGNQPVLAEGQAAFGMSCDLEKELSVPSRVGQLTGWGAAERETTEDKRPGVEGEFLLSGVALLAGKVDQCELPKAALRNPEGRKTGPNCG